MNRINKNKPVLLEIWYNGEFIYKDSLLFGNQSEIVKFIQNKYKDSHKDQTLEWYGYQSPWYEQHLSITIK